jgi:hypothetical protein
MRIRDNNSSNIFFTKYTENLKNYIKNHKKIKQNGKETFNIELSN